MIGFSLPMMIVASLQGAYLVAIAGGIIWFIASSPDYARKFANKKSLEYYVHMIAAYGGILLGLVALWINLGLWHLTIGAGIIILLLRLFKVRNMTWWVEVVAFITILIGLIC